jgi:uncharacterized circularly permuted ATP-grasp superfamily protein
MTNIDFSEYQISGFYDEMFNDGHSVRPSYELFKKGLENISRDKLSLLQHATDRAQLSLGMTFNVYSDNEGVERILHLDIIPRIVSGKDWDSLSRGLQQRIVALNLFIY